MGKQDMTLDTFIEISKAYDNHNGSWSVEIVLKNGVKSTLTVDFCKNEYDAKERSYLYLKDRIENK